MNHYKGRTSFEEVINMPNRMFHYLYISLIKKLSTDDGQEQSATEQLNDKIEEEMT